MDCIFCKIIKGEIPSNKIYEDEDVLAFLDINPCNKGHTLVITKEHYETFNDIPKDKLEKLTSTTQDIAKAIVETTSCHGFNIAMNNKKAAGQLVPHVHFHIIPRFDNDNVVPPWKHGKYEEREAEEYCKSIKKRL